MDDDDAADVLPELMAEAIEIAQIRSNVSFAINLQRFLQRALPLPGRRPYQTVDAALQDVRQLASSIGVALCQSALADFVRGAVSAPMASGSAAIVESNAGGIARHEEPETLFPALMGAVSPIEFKDPPTPERFEWPDTELIAAPAEIQVAQFEIPKPAVVTEAVADAFEWPAREPIAAPAEIPVAQFEMPEPAVVTDAVADAFAWPAIEPIAAAPAEIRPAEFEDTPPELPVVEEPQPAPIQQSARPGGVLVQSETRRHRRDPRPRRSLFWSRRHWPRRRR
jgi:hypothetical protein